MSSLPEMGSAPIKIFAAVFYGEVLIIPRWSFAGPKARNQVADFCSAPMAGCYAAVDTNRTYA